MRMVLSHLERLQFNMGGKDEDHIAREIQDSIKTGQGNQCQTNNIVHRLETNNQCMGMQGISINHKILRCSLDMDHLVLELEEILCH